MRKSEGQNEEFTAQNYPELRCGEGSEETPPILESEVKKSIRSLAKGKAVGADGVAQEMLEAGGDAVVSWLTKICNNAVAEGDIPEEWGQSVIIPIFKKGDVTACGNYRPISLLSHAYKILAKVMQGRIRDREERILTEEQAGFRAGRGTIDQVFSFSQVAEKMWEVGRDIYCVFVDFKQAFDSIWREAF